MDKEGTTRSPYLKEWVAWVDKFFDVDDAGVYLREIPNDDPVEDMPSRKISAKKTPPNPPKPNKCTQCTDFTRGDRLNTPSEKHVSYVAIQKPSEGMKPQGFLQRIALMLMLILEDPVVLPIALLASCVKPSLMKPPWLFARNGLPLPRRLKVPPSTR